MAATLAQVRAAATGCEGSACRNRLDRRLDQGGVILRLHGIERHQGRATLQLRISPQSGVGTLWSDQARVASVTLTGAAPVAAPQSAS